MASSPPVLAPAPARAEAIDPAPPRGLDESCFRRLCRGGMGDGHNNYAHSMAWYRGKLYLGTTRSNLCMLKLQTAYAELPLEVWPVECPDTLDDLYRIDRRAQIWRYDPDTGAWEMVYRAPMVEGREGAPVSREFGYRSMVAFQGRSDPEPALYVSAWAPGRAPGGLILRSQDGEDFEPVTRYGIFERPVSATRSLTVLDDMLMFSPTARRGTDGSQPNVAGLPVIFASRDPDREDWAPVSEPGFGEAGNLGIFTLCPLGRRLYAGTFNLDGLQVWAGDWDRKPSRRWRKVVDRGAGRGALNQCVASMTPFKGAIYVGTGIQGGGRDRVNDVGPAAAELIRINADDSWDIIVGEARDCDDGRKEPLSGLRAGFGNLFNGYIWAFGVHDGWLYAGTYDWSVTLRWAKMSKAPEAVRKFVDRIGTDRIAENQGGFDLWRSYDGENWLPVDRHGFGNVYNWGVRNFVSTPHGLFVGTANPFGPRVAVRDGGRWTYADNPDGGLEVWLGHPAYRAGRR